MRISEMNWTQVEDYLKRDDRAVLPIGSTEQHAQLSLAVDCILAERVSVEAAEPLGIPVFPTLNYGIAPYFRAFPGSISLRLRTYVSVIEDVLDCLAGQGFRRIVIVNGHGGNAPAHTLMQEWMNDHTDIQVKFHNWWNAPRVWKKVQEIDSLGSHASWMENFPWTRLPGVVAPEARKPMIDVDRLHRSNAHGVRAQIGDGNFGGLYQRADDEMLALWAVAVAETRELIDGHWA